jgi:hypothetical protein
MYFSRLTWELLCIRSHVFDLLSLRTLFYLSLARPFRIPFLGHQVDGVVYLLRSCEGVPLPIYARLCGTVERLSAPPLL